MVHRMFRYAAGWEWHLLLEERDITVPVDLPSRKDSYRRRTAIERAATEVKLGERHHERADPRERLRDIRRILPECAAWLETALGSGANAVAAGRLADGQPVVFGTLMLQMSAGKDDVQPLHYWIHPSRLVTVPADYRLALRLQQTPWKETFERCADASEAFTVLLAVVLETFHAGLDSFGVRLGKLQEAINTDRRTDYRRPILECRQDLLHWNHLYVPVCEIQNAAKEAFMERLTETEEFKRLRFKSERIGVLLAQYQYELDALAALGETMRGLNGSRPKRPDLAGFALLSISAAASVAVWGLYSGRLAPSLRPWGVAALSVLALTVAIFMYRLLASPDGSDKGKRARRGLADTSIPPQSAAETAVTARLARNSGNAVKRASGTSPGKGRRGRRPYPGTMPAEGEPACPSAGLDPSDQGGGRNRN